MPRLHLPATRSLWGAMLLLLGLGSAIPPAHGADYPDSVKNLPPLTITHNGQTRNISLAEIFKHHGNACPGATMAFLAVRYGLSLLYSENEIPDTSDLVIVIQAPGGPMDVLDVIMKEGDRDQRTWPPAGITPGTDNFIFQFFRKSTLRAVTVKLKEGLWPEDWFLLREKKRAKTITEAEQEKMQRDRQTILLEFPAKPLPELFGEPKAYTFLAWGLIEPGEMDKRIRRQRQAHRERDRPE